MPAPMAHACVAKWCGGQPTEEHWRLVRPCMFLSCARPFTPPAVINPAALPAAPDLFKHAPHKMVT